MGLFRQAATAMVYSRRGGLGIGGEYKETVRRSDLSRGFGIPLSPIVASRHSRLPPLPTKGLSVPSYKSKPNRPHVPN